MTEQRAAAAVDDSWLEDPVADAEGSAGAPTWLLLVAAVGLLVGLVTLGGAIGLQVLGYLTASVLLFTAVATYRRLSLERSFRFGVRASRAPDLVALALLVVGFVVALVHAWNIANHLS